MRKLRLDELGRLSQSDYRISKKIPVVVVLDNIRSALNVGSIFRTADGFVIERMVLCGITATPPHREIHKTAIGASETVAWTYVEHAVNALRDLQEQGYAVILIEQTDTSTSLANLAIDPTEKYVLVFGNEVDGVSDEVVAEFTTAVEVRQFGTKHSFNVSACAGMVLWEVSRQLRVASDSAADNPA